MFLVRLHSTASARLGISLILAVAIGFETFHFWKHAEIAIRTLPYGDGTLFFPMGRAWLNGLAFYRDLFETKPPLLFLLAAWSLKLTGDNVAYVWLQEVLLGLLAPVFAFLVYQLLNHTPRAVRCSAVALSFLLGLSLAVDAQQRSGGTQAEGFALIFATLPALLFALPASARRMWIVDLFAGASLGIAAMLKEPFVGVGLMALLVFLGSKSELRRIVRILFTAAATALVVLAWSGALVTYFTIYLPEMFNGRAMDAEKIPDFGLRVWYTVPSTLWMRSLDVSQILTGLATRPTSGVYLSIFFGICLCLLPSLRLEDFRTRSMIASTAIISSVLFAAHQFVILLKMLGALQNAGVAVPWNNSLIHFLLASIGGPPAAVLVGIAIVPRRFRPSWQVCVMSLGICIASFIVGALVSFGGNYNGEYLIFAFPILLALGAFCIAAAAEGRHFLTLGFLAATLMVNALLPGRYDYRVLNSVEWHSGIWQQQAVAIDTLLDRCHFDRYFVYSPSPELPNLLTAATRHSPYQLSYGQQRALGGFDVLSSEHRPNPFLAAKFHEDLAATSVIIAFPQDGLDVPSVIPSAAPAQREVVTSLDNPNPPSVSPEIVEAVREHFTLAPPSCAVGIVPISGLEVYFRQ